MIVREGKERKEGVAYFGVDEEYSAQHPLNILYGQFSCILYHVCVCVCMHVWRERKKGVKGEPTAESTPSQHLNRGIPGSNSHTRVCYRHHSGRASQTCAAQNCGVLVKAQVTIKHAHSPTPAHPPMHTLPHLHTLPMYIHTLPHMHTLPCIPSHAYLFFLHEDMPFPCN